MKLGIGSWTYGWAVGVPNYPFPESPLTAMGILEKAEQLGVEVIQIADNLPLHSLSDEALRDLKKAADDRGVVIEAGTRGIEPDHLLRYLEICDILGSKILRTLLHTPQSTPGIDEAAERIGKVLPRFETAGVVIAIENHDKYTSRELSDLVKSLDSESVGICLDTVNNFGALEGPEQVVNCLGTHTVNLHFKDFDIVRVSHQMGFTILGRPAGEGRLNADWLLSTLKSMGRDFNVILEQWTPFYVDIGETVRIEEDWARRGVRFLKDKLRRE